MATISGILINGAGQLLPNVQIVLTALKTSSKVLNQSKALITTTSETGAYSINAQVGNYAVTILRNGYPVEKVGCIKVYVDSQDGTLNDYLLNPNESEISPEILAQIVEERKLAQKSASDAKNSANEAVETLENCVKKTGEASQTVDGTLDVKELKENGQQVYSPNNKPTASDVGALSNNGGVVGPISVQDGKTPTVTIKDTRVDHFGQFFSNDSSFGFYTSNPTGTDGGYTRFRYSYGTQIFEFGNCTLRYKGYEVLSRSGGEVLGDLMLRKVSPALYLQTSTYAYNTAFKQQDGGLFECIHYNNGSWKAGFNFSPTTNTLNFSYINVTWGGVPLLKKGDYGLGSKAPLLPANTNLQWDACTTFSRQYTLSGRYVGTPDDTKSWGGTLEVIRRLYDSSTACFQIIRYQSRTYEREGDIISGNWVWSNWKELITTANSTVDSNGFLKSASPIIRLFSNDDVDTVDGFEKSGCGLINSEAKGVTANKIAIGHYEIHGSLGFAKEGWYITLPEDANGNKKLFAEYSTDENNVITIKTYTKKFDFEKCEVVAGEPQDITDGRWIDIRLEMPIIEIVEQIEPIPSTLNPIMS